MPLCPQITNTPITVVLNADFTVTDVVPVLPANTEQLDDVVVLLDGKTKAFYQTTAPTVGVSEGDIWFDTDDGNKQYFYNGTAWVSVQDTAIAAAQTTADGKNRIYRQGTTPTGTFAVGDLWFNTSNDNSISRWDGSTFVANTLGNNALASISASKITAGTIDASVITVSNINAGNISTGSLASARIAAGTIIASQIATATITATQIAAGTITASNLAVGTLSADNITTGTLSATVSLAATTGTIGGFTLSSTTLTGAGGFSLSSSGQIDGGNSNTIFYGFINIGGGTAGSERLIVTGTSALNGNTSVLGNITATNSATFGTSGSQFEFLSSSGNVRVAQTYNNDMGGTTRAMRVNTAGLYGYASSTRRRKEQIANYSINSQALLSLPVRKFKYINDETDVQQYGFIAEEAQDLGLDELIQYDSEGQPDYFAYETLPIFLLQLIQELKAEIDQLKGA